MSTEASGDGKPDAVDQAEQEPKASETSSAGEILMADTETDEADESAAPAADDAAAWPDRDEAEEDEQDGEDREDGEYFEVVEYDEYEYEYDADDDGRDPSDPDAPSDLIELAEPVEFDEPATPGRRRRWTRLLVALGFLIVAAAIIGGAFAIVGSVTHGFKKPVKITYKKSAVFSLKTGDCFDPTGQTYTLISCDAPHQAEVFGTFTLAGGKWPGTTAVAAAASSGCATRLTSYLNPQLAISLASTYVYPDATAWQAGTRTVICEVRATSGELTGSVRGASATAG